MSRVQQIDAFLLDSQLSDLLVSQLSISPSIDRNLIKFIIDTVLFKVTIFDKSQSYGLFLQNLKFGNKLTLSKKVLYWLLVVVGNYKLKSKLNSTALKVYNVLSFASYITFILRNDYPSLILRLLRIKISPINNNKMNNLSFEFQNRQLIWNTFLEFVLFILPILTSNAKFQYLLNNLLHPGSSSSSAQQQRANNSLIKPTQCPICVSNHANVILDFQITNPYKVNCCGRQYCYVCVLKKLDQAKKLGSKWKCMQCLQDVDYCETADDDYHSKAVMFTVGEQEIEDLQAAGSEEEAVEEEKHRSEVEQSDNEDPVEEEFEYENDEFDQAGEDDEDQLLDDTEF
ncbi:hypothetical protein WICPIJ_004579 [Wickerhamomyces pijperi]|uniref:RING-type E3 ubiquitin transferase (cysteine targeting) n=1 Tax=Wickerhamomyces pijperi TaxID=599730 RepID=A0A9P8Q5F1_WICPI|nr:hypothetical protein WICPIJ_004579 [Wickerhamomyces pijperi]